VKRTLAIVDRIIIGSDSSNVAGCIDEIQVVVQQETELNQS